ncbi:MAG: ParB/RepB/Spo0J family partition protein [Treponema sp.]|nr:ParB/RepB/Spo0J family partition protein [Treponema sp.]
MPLLQRSNAPAINISLDRIMLEGNVRTDYTEIEELAASIRQYGLLSPVTVKAKGDGSYRLICGHRRYKAYKYLLEQGEPYSQIPAVVITTNAEVELVQLIENIQRVDLSPKEKEQALKELVDKGMDYVSIAKELHKSKQWVSNAFAGIAVREKAEKEGINTDNIATSTLSEIRTIANKDMANILSEIQKKGGSQSAARKIVKEYKQKKNGKNNTADKKEAKVAISEVINDLANSGFLDAAKYLVNTWQGRGNFQPELQLDKNVKILLS